MVMKHLFSHPFPILIFLTISILLNSGCGFYYHLQCRKKQKTNESLLAGKYDFGKKDKKYKKQNRKALCYYKRK